MQRRATILMAALAVVGTAGLSVARQPAGPNAPLPESASVVEQRVSGLRNTLFSPETVVEDRLWSALQLATTPGEAGSDAITEALAPGSEPAVRLAAAAAVAQTQGPAPAWIEPLLAILREQAVPAQLQAQVGLALGNYDSRPDLIDALSAIATGAGPLPGREAAAVALGRMPSKSAASTLVVLLDGDVPESLERAAVDSLEVMTGLKMPLGDVQAWRTWWQGVTALDENAFGAQLVASRAARARADRERADSAAAALLNATRESYRRLDAAQRTALLLEHLQSPVGVLRETAAALTLEDAEFAEDLAPAVKEQIRQAIADPEPTVRVLAAKIVQRSNDPAAIPNLMTQLEMESSDPARVAQLDALGDLRAVDAMPLVLARLGDPSPAVQIQAARTAAELASVDGGANLTRSAADALRELFLRTPSDSRTARRIRLEVLRAMAGLNDGRLVNFYIDLLTRAPRPTASMREQALRGLGTIGDNRVGNIVTQFLRDEDPRVRESAVRTLATTSLGFERGDTVRVLLDERNEPSEAVRRAAWQTLQAMLPRASDSQLANLADRFSTQPDRELEVLRVLVQKLQEAGDREQAASFRQRMGDVLLATNRPAEAGEQFAQALEYSLTENPMAGTIKVRTDSLLRARLRARQFDEAARLAAESLARDQGYLEDLGTVIKLEAERLRADGQADAVRELVSFALNLAPPLDPRTSQQLRGIVDSLPPAE